MIGDLQVLPCAKGHESILTHEELVRAFGYNKAVDIELGMFSAAILPASECPDCVSDSTAVVIPFPMHRVRPA